MKSKKLLVIPLLLTSILASCGDGYKYVNEIKDVDFFNQKESSYGVYYYSENCPNCVNTLPYINQYIDKAKSNPDNYEIKNIYFIDAKKTPLQRLVDRTTSDLKGLLRQITVGATTLDMVYQIGYPILYVVSNVESINTVTSIAIGEAEVTSFIKSIW